MRTTLSVQIGAFTGHFVDGADRYNTGMSRRRHYEQCRLHHVRPSNSSKTTKINNKQGLNRPHIPRNAFEPTLLPANFYARRRKILFAHELPVVRLIIQETRAGIDNLNITGASRRSTDHCRPHITHTHQTLVGMQTTQQAGLYKCAQPNTIFETTHFPTVTPL